MLFGDAFSILQPTDPIPTSGKFGLTLWPVSSQVIRSTLKSLTLDSLADPSSLRQISVLAVFSYFTGGATDKIASVHFQVEEFSD